jgi:hypothetical protein
MEVMTRLIPLILRDYSNAAAHFTEGSALHQFIAGHLGAPDYWRPRKQVAAHVPAERRAIERWETDGGKPGATGAPVKTARSRSNSST